MEDIERFKQQHPGVQVRIRAQPARMNVSAPQQSQVQTLDERSLRRDRIPCENPACRNGGYNLTREVLQTVRAMLQTGEVKKEIFVRCTGSERMGQGRFRDCLNNLEVTIEVDHVSAETK